MERYIRAKEVAEILSIGQSTVWLYTKTGKLPQPIKLSAKNGDIRTPMTF